MCEERTFYILGYIVKRLENLGSFYRLCPRIIYCCIIALCLFRQDGLNAQLRLLNTDMTLCDTCDRELSLRINSASFFQNNEYFNPYTEGYTGIGFFVRPTLEYYFAPSTRVSAGVHLLKYSGESVFKQLIPIFTVHHEFNEQFAIVMGSLYGTLHHKLEQALMRYDLFYQDNNEYGLQFLYKPRWADMDMWLDWEDFLFPGEESQERFTLGLRADFLISDEKAWTVRVPIEGMWRHQGGQIDQSPLPVLSILNAAVGVDLSYRFSEDFQLSLRPRYLLSSGLEYNPVLGNTTRFASGDAYYLKLHLTLHKFRGMIAYWDAHRFIAPRGEYLFLNISDYKPDFYTDDKRLLTARIAFEQAIGKTMSFQVLCAGYYDLARRQLDYSYGIYFLINHDFFLKELNDLKP